MKSAELKARQAPLKERFKTDPDDAKVTLKARGTLEDGITCRVETGKTVVTAGLHPKTGGDGSAACSADMLLESLVACAGVTLSAVATALDISISGGTVTAEGDLDFRGTLGVDRAVPVGFSAIRLKFDLQSSATPEQLDTLYKLTERYCVIYQTLRNPPALTLVR